MTAVEVPVEIKSQEMIKPAEKTWLGTMELSVLDIFYGKTFTPVLYVYKPNKQWTTTSISETLKESLGKVLVHFYPFAGRLRPMGVGKMVLDVDDTSETWGVPVVEAETTMELLDLGGDDFFVAEQKGRFRNLFSIVDQEKPIEELPLLMVKITHFRCGGVTIAITSAHAVVDGAGAGHFLTEWTRIARGEPLGAAPAHDRTLLRARELSRSVPKYIHPIDDNVPPPSPSQKSIVTLPLSKSQIEKLKIVAGPNTNDRPYTRFEVLAAHVWRCLNKARSEEDKKVTCFGIFIDIRKRIDPPLPQTYNGNSVILMNTTSKVEYLVSSPLGYACDIIRKTIDKVTNDLIWTYLHYKKSLVDVGNSTPLFMTPEIGHYAYPEVSLVAWMNLPFNNLDFGWGHEAHIACERKWIEGQGYVQVGKEEGSLIIVMNLQTTHVDKFKKYFFDHLD